MTCKREERRIIHRDTVVLHVPGDHRTHIRAEFREGLVPAPPKLQFDGLQFCLHPCAHRPPQHGEAALPGRRTAVREPEEVEALRLALAAPSPIRRRMAPEFEESRFLGMQRQTEPRESLAQAGEKLLGVVLMLEPDDKIIGEADDDDIAVRSAIDEPRGRRRSAGRYWPGAD